jgi:tetratricopeptide (TPR) repeat protein
VGLLSAFAEALFGAAADDVHQRVRARRTQRTVAYEAAEAGDLRWARRTVARWLDQEDVAQILMGPMERPENQTKLTASLVDRIKSTRRGSRLPVEAVRESASRAARHVAQNWHLLLEPVEATAVADERDRARHEATQAEVRRLAVRSEEPAETDLRALPPGARRRVEEAWTADPLLGRRLLDLFTGPGALRRVSELAEGGLPAALTVRPELTWPAVAAFLLAHAESGAGSRCLERAARHGAGVKSRWFARAALGAAQADDPDRAEALLAEAEQLAGTSPDPFLDLIRAAIDEDPPRLLEFGSQPLPDDLSSTERSLVTRLMAAANIHEGNLDRAVRLLRPLAAKDDAGAQVDLARTLFRRAHDRGGPTGDSDLTEALENALRARDAIRRWHGDSGDAVAVASATAGRLGDWPMVLRLTALPPDGEATPAEASSPAAVSQRAAAAIIGGRGDLAESAAGEAPDRFNRELVRGMVATDHQEDLEAAESALRSALQVARDEGEVRQALFSLANTGAVDLPGLDDIERDDAPFAALLRSMAAFQRGEIREAFAFARPFQGQSMTCAEWLATLHLQEGEPERAALAFEAVDSRFGSPRAMGAAADAWSRAGQPEEARRAATKGLADVSANSPTARRFRRQLLQLEFELHNWRAAEGHARALLDRCPEDVEARWSLGFTLAAQGAFDAAWTEIADLPHQDVVDRALLWVDVARRTRPVEQWAGRALDITEEIGGREVREAVTVSLLLRSRDSELATADAERLRELLAQVGPAEEGGAIWSIDVGEDLEGLTEALGRTSRGAATRIRDTAEAIRHGRLPLGALASAAGRTVTEIIARGGIGYLPAGAADPLVQREERAAAVDALGQDVVVELSAGYIAGLVPGVWDRAVGSFARLFVGEHSLADLVGAEDALDLPREHSLSWNIEAEQPLLVEHDPKIEGEVASAVRELAARLRSCDRVAVPTIELDGRAFELERFGVQLDAIEAARRTGATLYCDDRVLRAMARQAGVRTFGTIALLKALRDVGDLSETAHGQAFQELRRNFVADLPFDEAALRELALEEELDPRAAAFQLTRSTAWVDPARTFELFDWCLDRLQDAPSQFPGWLAALTLGAGSVAGPRGSEVAAAYLARGILTLSLDPEDMAGAVEAARDAASHIGGSDPLVDSVHKLYVVLTGTVGRLLAVARIESAFTELDDNDRDQVQQVLDALSQASED